MILMKIMTCKKLNHLAKKEILENIPRDFFYMILTADKSGVQYISFMVSGPFRLPE